MKIWKRLGSALLAVLTLTALLSGTALAAEPGQEPSQDLGIGVQLNGAPLSFTDAEPEITNERTFLPFRAVLEAMGAQVDYDEQTSTVTAQRDGVALSMVPGQSRLTVTENGQARTVEMDTAPYINVTNNRTYIPVRYAAEAFGYSVGWDPDSRTVVLVDVESLFGEATFDLLDNFAAYCDKQAAPENMAVTGSLALDLNDRTGKNLPKPIQANGSVDGVVGEKGVQLKASLALEGLTEMVDALNGAGSPMEEAILQYLLATLSNLTVELRADLESGMLYVSLPAAITGTEDTWYSLDLSAYQAELLSSIDPAQLAGLEQLEDATVREALIWVMQSIPVDDSVNSYPSLALMAKLYTDMLSDQAFTQTGNTYTAKTVLEDIVTVEVTLTKQGEDIVAMDLSMTASADEDGSKMSMTMTEHAAPDKVDMVMDLSVSDAEMSMSLNMNLNCVPTEKTPETLPPAGVQVTPVA